MPQSPRSQPRLVPVRPSCSRRISSRVSLGRTATRVRLAVDGQVDDSLHGPPRSRAGSLGPAVPSPSGCRLQHSPVSTLTSSSRYSLEARRSSIGRDASAASSPASREHLRRELLAGHELAGSGGHDRGRRHRARARSPPRGTPGPSMHHHRRDRGDRQRQRNASALAQAGVAGAGRRRRDLDRHDDIRRVRARSRAVRRRTRRSGDRPLTLRRDHAQDRRRGRAGSAPCRPRAPPCTGCRRRWPGCAPVRRRAISAASTMPGNRRPRPPRGGRCVDRAVAPIDQARPSG